MASRTFGNIDSNKKSCRYSCQKLFEDELLKHTKTLKLDEISYENKISQLQTKH